MSNETVQTNLIAGGGSSAVGIVKMATDELIARHKGGAGLPHTHYEMADKTGQHGPGYGHNVDNTIFRVNQPADAMSINDNDHDEFAKYLAHKKNVSVDDIRDYFATRHEFKSYTIHEASALQEKARDMRASGIAVSLELNNRHIVAAHKHNGIITATDAQGYQSQADHLVVVTGHQNGHFLSHLKGHPRYQSGIFDISKVSDVVKGDNPPDKVLIIGTGQSMVDAVALLDHLHYQGTTYAVSGQLVMPWPYIPAEYKQKTKYKLKHLTARNIDFHRYETEEELDHLLQQEVAQAEAEQYGRGIVYSSVDLEKMRALIYQNPDLKGLKAVHSKLVKLYSDPTTPERYAMLQSMEEQGRLVFQRGQVKPQNIHVYDDYFAIDDVFCGTQTFGMILNGASISSDPFACPLLADLKRQDLLTINHGRIKPGQQSDKQIHVNGPAAHPNKNGIETFRVANKEIADALVDSAYAFKAQTGPHV